MPFFMYVEVLHELRPLNTLNSDLETCALIKSKDDGCHAPLRRET